MRKKIALLAAACIFLAACSRNVGKSESPAASASDAAAASQAETGADTRPTGEPVPDIDAPGNQTEYTFSQMSLLNNELGENVPDDNYGTTYEVFVYSFADSDGDGIGDLNGLCDNIRYINDGQPSVGVDLSANEIWLMPIFPSPTYHKYDTTNYMEIDPQYGTMEDFDKLLAECHKKGVKVILDLALNHTSTEHPWFVAAKEYLQHLPAGKDPVKEECPYVWYYVFSRENYQGFAPLDGTWSYEARFWEGMPDLNLSTPEVRQELTNVMKFWLDRGVDGFRLDAVTSYVTDSTEGNMDIMTWIADTVHGIKPDAYLVGEAWEDQSAYARYYGTGINSFFDFAFSGPDGIIASVAKGNRSAKSYAEALVSEEELYASVNGNFINAPFYTNHDMARSAGYYPTDDGSRTKFAGALNLLMTGNAFIYYGEELGMEGSGRDENKRAPMYWITEEEARETSENGSAGEKLLANMCSGPAQMEKTDMKFGTAYAQVGDEMSVHTYYRNAVRIRNAFPVIARGRTAVDYDRTTDAVCAMTREDPEGRYEPVEIFINATERPASVDLSGSTYTELRAVLTVTRDEVIIEGGRLTLPPYGICVMSK